MKIGDLVTAYWKGYYEIINIKRRWERKQGETPYQKQAYCLTEYDPETCGIEMNPLYNLIQRYSAEGKPVKTSKIQTCDSGFCKLAKDFIPLEVNRLEVIINDLNNIKL